MDFRINNIKVSVKLNLIPLNIVKDIIKDKNLPLKEYQNFIVFNLRYTYTIFKSKGKNDYNHVNITKIPSIEKIDISMEILKKLFGKDILSHQIDNIIATSKWKNKLNLLDLSQIRYEHPMKYNNQKFPGLFIKYTKGTALVFFSGKVVIVGCKTREEISEIASKLHCCFELLT